MVSAGRVLLMPKGEYNAATPYTMLDLVSYNGSSYVAKKSTTGNLPTNTAYWQLSAYGGSAANLAGNFATLETTDYATQDYDVDDFLVNKDNQFCKVIADITTGDELVLDTNIEVTNVGELIQAVISYTDGLDAKNVKLNGAVAISAQTDLNDMTTVGNYYKSSTSFYVTNAPTGIASELTAVFRLTVENGSDTTDKYIQTLRTNDGKIYTRGYDGSTWGDWIEFVDKAELGTAAAKDSTNAVTQSSEDLVESGAVYTGLAAKQPKTLDTAITVDGVQQTTVEDALGAINTEVSTKAFEIDDTTETTLASDDVLPFYDTSATAKRKMTVQKFGEQLISNPNLLDNPWFTVNQRGETTYSSGSNRDTLDRWRAEAAIEVSIDSDNVVTLTTSSAAQFMQRIPLDDLKFLYGKTVTVSVMLSNGNVISNTFAIPSTLPAENTNYGAFDIGNSYDVYLRIYSSREFFAFCIHSVATTTATISIKAVKLELGTVSTLALDTAPNYAEELLKCQRYFVSYRVDVDNLRWVGGSGVTVGEHLCQIPVYLPVAMRARPSISYSNIKGYFPYITGQTNSVAIVTGELTVNRITGNIVILTYNTENQSGFTALTRGMGMFLWIDSDNDAHIDLSADL